MFHGWSLRTVRLLKLRSCRCPPRLSHAGLVSLYIPVVSHRFHQLPLPLLVGAMGQMAQRKAVLPSSRDNTQHIPVYPPVGPTLPYFPCFRLLLLSLYVFTLFSKAPKRSVPCQRLNPGLQPAGGAACPEAQADILSTKTAWKAQQQQQVSCIRKAFASSAVYSSTHVLKANSVILVWIASTPTSRSVHSSKWISKTSDAT